MLFSCNFLAVVTAVCDFIHWVTEGEEGVLGFSWLLEYQHLQEGLLLSCIPEGHLITTMLISCMCLIEAHSCCVDRKRLQPV